MSYEQVDTLRLEYAKRYYLQGCCTKGDQFLKSVEQNKNKTKHTIKLLEELKRNKRVYTNRNDNTSMPLQLTMQPKKNN